MRYPSGPWALGAATALFTLLAGTAAHAELPRVDLGVGIWDHDVTGTLTSDDPLLQMPAGVPAEADRDLYGRFSVRLANRWWAPTLRARYSETGATSHAFVDNSTYLGNVLLNLNTLDTKTEVDLAHLEGLLYFTLGSTVRAELGAGLKKFDSAIAAIQVNATSGGTTTVSRRREFPMNTRVFYGAVYAEPVSWLSFGGEIVGGTESMTDLMDLTLRFVVRPWDWLGVEGGYRRLTIEAQDQNNVDLDFEFGGPYAGLSFFYATPEPVAADAGAEPAEPVVDSDNDSVPDGLDECPGSTAGVVVDDRGCPQGEAEAAAPVAEAAAPPTLLSDADSDGIVDTQDQCADTPAGAPIDGSGCLQGDRDQDGVKDDQDVCPGGSAGAVDSTGCPMAGAAAPTVARGHDADDDGVPDAQDRCPHTVGGLRVDDTGCAMAGESSVLQGVTFQKNSSYLMRDSQVLLLAVVDSLKAQRTMKVEIQGHTCDLGDAKYNQWMSQRRANRVLEFLVRHGIDARRLTAVGYGESQPMIPNDDESMRELNRRTVFKVISR